MSCSPKPHVFSRSGLAALSDVQRPENRQFFAEFEDRRVAFLRREEAIRGVGNARPLDIYPFWSRVWEYPYVYFHLEKLRSETPRDSILKAVDLGSGFTVFPFLVAQLGYHVDCLDIDATAGLDIERIAAGIDHEPGKVEFRLINDGDFSLEDGAVDVIYCVSVLEHIPDFQKTIEEAFRVLKPNGLLILTIDIDLCGFMEIGVDRYQNLRKTLLDYFDFREPETTVHPMNMLQPRNSPVPFLTFSTWQRWKYQVRDSLRPLFGRKRLKALPNVAVWGGVMARK